MAIGLRVFLNRGFFTQLLTVRRNEMNAYQLRILIYDLYCNDPKLRELAKEGILVNKDLWALQDKAIELAQQDDLLTD